MKGFFKGSATALITPFDEKGVNYPLSNPNFFKERILVGGEIWGGVSNGIVFRTIITE